MTLSIDNLLQHAAELVSQQPTLAIASVFVLALSESLPVIGTVVPGTATILTVAAIAGAGLIPVWAVLLAACLCAIVGDGVAYWIGLSYQERALRIWPLSRYPDAIARSEEFFARHGGKSIAIARFTPVVRAFVLLVAGISRMCPRRFYIANIASAVIWAMSHVIPAAAAGASFIALHQRVGVLPLVAFAGLGLVFLVWWTLRARPRLD